MWGGVSGGWIIFALGVSYGFSKFWRRLHDLRRITDLHRVGGVVGENSFKFFIQFVFYTAVYCLSLLAVMANYLHEQLITPVSIPFCPDHIWTY
jgi:hypothetical protein